MLNFSKLIDGADHVGQSYLGIHGQITTAGHITLQVDADRGALGAGSRQANHDTAAVVQQDAKPLAFGDGAVDWIDVAEVVGVGDLATCEGLTDQAWEHALKAVVQTMGCLTGYRFVVVT